MRCNRELSIHSIIVDEKQNSETVTEEWYALIMVPVRIPEKIRKGIAQPLAVGWNKSWRQDAGHMNLSRYYKKKTPREK